MLYFIFSLSERRYSRHKNRGKKKDTGNVGKKATWSFKISDPYKENIRQNTSDIMKGT